MRGKDYGIYASEGSSGKAKRQEEMVIFGAGDGITCEIGFQAKSYLSEEVVTFRSVARSSLAYTAFFWIVMGVFTALFL